MGNLQATPKSLPSRDMALFRRVSVAARPAWRATASPAMQLARGLSAGIHSKEDLDHMTGLQRMEAERELEGETLFDRSGLSGPFGTRENPVVVPSAYPFRAVACTGGYGDAEHEMLWFNLFEGKKAICPECGQFFVLDYQP